MSFRATSQRRSIIKSCITNPRKVHDEILLFYSLIFSLTELENLKEQKQKLIPSYEKQLKELREQHAKLSANVENARIAEQRRKAAETRMSLLPSKQHKETPDSKGTPNCNFLGTWVYNLNNNTL